MLCLALHQRIACFCIVRVDKLLWRECGTAVLTLVTICLRGMTTRTFATNIAVGQEMTCLFVVELLAHLLHKLALIVEFAEEVACQFVMSLRGGTTIDIE